MIAQSATRSKSNTPVFSGTGFKVEFPVKIEALTSAESLQLEASEEIIERGLDTFLQVGIELERIRAMKLYRGEFSRFEDYCHRRWGMTGRRARQLAAASTVMQNLSSLLPPSEQPSLNNCSEPGGSANTPKGNGDVPKLGRTSSRASGRLSAAGPAIPIPQGQPQTSPAPRLPETESQARGLSGLPPEEQREVWGEVLYKAGDRKITAALIDEVIESRKWPKPNEYGVYDAKQCKAEVIGYQGTKFTAAVTVLQIGEGVWISSWEHDCRTSSHGQPLCTRIGKWGTRSDALCAACDEGYGVLSRLRTSGNVTAAVSETMLRAMSWARLTSGRASVSEHEQRPTTKVDRIILVAQRAIKAVSVLQGMLDRTDTTARAECQVALARLDALEKKFERKKGKR